MKTIFLHANILYTVIFDNRFCFNLFYGNKAFVKEIANHGCNYRFLGPTAKIQYALWSSLIMEGVAFSLTCSQKNGFNSFFKPLSYLWIVVMQIPKCDAL